MKLPLLSILNSKVKREKIALLVQERGLIAQSVVLAPFQHLFSKGAGLSKAHDEHSPEPSRSFTWQYTSRLDIPGELLSDAGTLYKQDNIQAGGELLTELDYTCAVYDNASLYSNGTTHVSAFDCHDRRLAEFSSIKFNTGVPETCRLNQRQFLPGTSLSLYGNVENATGNIGHWMIDGVSRLFLALQHIDIGEIDNFLVPTFTHDFQLESLLALGIAREKIVELAPLQCVLCEHLVLTSKPRGYSSCTTPGWLIDGYRDHLLPAVERSEKKRRLYISRRDAGSRKFVDEEQIISGLEAFGFEAVEMSKFDFMEKINLFANAEIVVGLTGAGMTNLMFCSPGTKVIELFPDSFVMHLYASMSSYLKLESHFVIFENQSAMSKMNKYYGDLHLKPSALLEKLKEIM